MLSLDSTRRLTPQRPLNSYMWGQAATLCNFAVYYAMFGSLATVTVGVGGLGLARTTYSLTLAMSQPLAGTVLERVGLRRSLVLAGVLRLLIWCIAVPVVCTFFTVGPGLPIVFAALMGLDGIVVALNSLADVDEGGMEVLSREYQIPLNTVERRRYNAIYEAAGACTQILLGPVAAWSVSPVANAVGSQRNSLLIVVSFLFGLFTLASLILYVRMGSPRAPHSSEAHGQSRNSIAELRSAVRLASQSPMIRARILLNSFDRGIQDVVLLVFIVVICNEVLYPKSVASASMATALVLVAARVGALLGASKGHRESSVKNVRAYGDELSGAFRRMFFATLALVPLAIVSERGENVVPPELCAFGLGACVMVFYYFTTLSVVYFRSMLQETVGAIGAPGRILGIQGFLVMSVSALMVGAATLLAVSQGVSTCITVSVIVFVTYGFVGARRGADWMMPRG